MLMGGAGVLLDAEGYSLVLVCGAPGATGRHWVLLGTPEYSWVLMGAPSSSWGVPGCSWDPRGCSQLLLVFPGPQSSCLMCVDIC